MVGSWVSQGKFCLSRSYHSQQYFSTLCHSQMFPFQCHEFTTQQKEGLEIHDQSVRQPASKSVRDPSVQKACQRDSVQPSIQSQMKLIHCHPFHLFSLKASWTAAGQQQTETQTVTLFKPHHNYFGKKQFQPCTH